jgi:ornithine carbamoyltransferase
LLSLADVGSEELSRLVDLSLAMERGEIPSPRPLEGKVAGIYFRGSSTRTRTAFTVAAHRLGAAVNTYGPNDLQLSTGETIQDTARVLSGFLDLLVVRTNDSMDEMRALASQREMAVVNAMSESEHPTQAIADLVTIKEAFGRLSNIHLLYVGEGNNTASALALAVSLTPGMRLTLATPAGYGVSDDVLDSAAAAANGNGSAIEQIHDPLRLPRDVDVVYTTRWQTMGVPKTEPGWKEKFRPFSVTTELMARVSKPSGTIFLHDLPAVRGDDVTDEVLDGPQSLAFRQARHKLSSAMAVLAWCVAP